MAQLFAKDQKEGKTICLNMIVKDESKVITRSLSSVKDLIDYWVIVDTGSTDGTQKIIKDFLKDISGELHERPWVNFEHNRNEALDLGKNKGDYLLFIDADEVLDFSKSFALPGLDKDVYYIPIVQEGSECLRVFLINNSLKCQWKGVLHEELTSSEVNSQGTFENAAILAYFQDSNRAQDPKKFLKDAKILEDALVKDPTNTRYVIFLAQCYACAKEPLLALQNFKKRAEMGGREEEVFWSLYQIGTLQELLKAPPQEIINSYCKAYEFRPARAEPLFNLGCYFLNNKNYLLGYAVAKLALSIPIPNDMIHVNRSIYEYRSLFLLANCAHNLNKTEEAISAYREILSKKDLPSAVRREISMNLLMLEQIPKKS